MLLTPFALSRIFCVALVALVFLSVDPTALPVKREERGGGKRNFSGTGQENLGKEEDALLADVFPDLLERKKILFELSEKLNGRFAVSAGMKLENEVLKTEVWDRAVWAKGILAGHLCFKKAHEILRKKELKGKAKQGVLT